MGLECLDEMPRTEPHFLSGDTDTTSSTTLSWSSSRIGVGYSASLDALIIAVLGSGIRMAMDAVGGFPEGTHGGGISGPINRAGGATTRHHAR